MGHHLANQVDIPLPQRVDQRNILMSSYRFLSTFIS